MTADPKLPRPELAQHTPTPWEVVEPAEDLHEFEPPFGHRFDNGEWETAGWVRLAPNVGDMQANAEFIVRAVNNFDSLLDLLREMREELKPGLTGGNDYRDAWQVFGKRIEEAIQKAEGKS